MERLNHKMMGCSIATLIFFTLACEHKTSHSDFVYSNFKETDSLEIETPKEYLQITNWSTYNRGKNKILVEYGFNKLGNLIIHQVDFEKHKYLEPVIIKRDGPEGYNSSSASVYIENADSIFVFPSARPFFLLYNRQGNLIKQLNYNSNDNSRYYRAGFYSNAVRIGHKIMIPTVQDFRYDDPNYFSKATPIRVYDFDKGLFDSKLPFPEYTYNKLVPSSFNGPTLAKYKEESVLINYRFADSIYIWNSKTNSTSGIYAGSEYFGKGKLLDRYPNRGEDLAYKIKEVDYELAKHHHDKIYRILNHITPNAKALKTFEIIERGLRKVSLIELDIQSKAQTYYQLPIAKYFIFQGNYLIAGGVSEREDGDKTLRKFYKYTLN